MLAVDLTQIEKYNVPGPRYTSYPPAVHFNDSLGEETLIRRIQANNETERPLSLYFHLPFCWSLCWYCGCNTVITTKQSRSATYIDYLDKEMTLMQRFLNPRRKVVQLHFGGGTPTFLLPEEIRELGRRIRSRFDIADDVEAGVEVDPRRMTRDHAIALREAGFNRASVGVQDFSAKVQQAINRIQPFEQTEQAVGWLREAGFQSISVDLIYGLPHQTVESFGETLQQAMQLSPDRLAVFSYAHVPWIKPAQRLFKPEWMPAPETKFGILKLTVEKLTSEGYVYIGMDHFAREGNELANAQREKTLQRNFQGYSTRAGADIYAFGVSSISQAESIYWQNHKDLPTYYARLDAGQLPVSGGYVLSGDDCIRRETIMRLMCDMGLDFDSMSRKLNIHFPDYFSRELATLEDLEADGLLQRNSAGIQVTDAGRLLVRNIAMRFDSYLAKKTEGVYSRTI